MLHPKRAPLGFGENEIPKRAGWLRIQAAKLARSIAPITISGIPAARKGAPTANETPKQELCSCGITTPVLQMGAVARLRIPMAVRALPVARMSVPVGGGVLLAGDGANCPAAVRQSTVVTTAAMTCGGALMVRNLLQA